jgi:Family of unknown function (DUF5362)
MMQSENTQQHIFEVGISDDTKNQLGGLSQWMQINAIVAFISLAVSIISTVLTLIRYSSLFGSGIRFGTSEIIRLLVSVVISVVLNLTLLQSSANIKKGLALTDQGYLNLGLSKLATCFKIIGILIIVVLSLLVLVFFLSLIMRF